MTSSQEAKHKTGASVLDFDLDRMCGEYFSYRDLVECGETWQRTRVANLPKEADTVQAMGSLCEFVLDPAVRQFGRVVLTYAFASQNLTRHIRGRICPQLDQHAGYELNTKGNLICARRGMAADFFVPGVNSRDVANWVIENTPFDRLYFYGDDRPIHVSIGPDSSRQIVEMRVSAGGKRVPFVVKSGKL